MPFPVKGVLALMLAAPSAPRDAADSLRPFTIKDAIEITHIVNRPFWSVNQDRPAAPILSPDRRHLLLITQRGVLASNRLESTIWVFDRWAVLEFLSGRSVARPSPKAVATFAAVSNVPVITDVRWLEDSRRIGFLARTDDGTPQLYVADVANGAIRAITDGKRYVSAYDIRGETIAYATLNDASDTSAARGDVVDVTGQSIWALLWRNRAIADRDEDLLLNVPNTLHVLRHGREVITSFTMDGRPLTLFFPVLSLAPDEASLVTVAPVHIIPAEWAAYQPWFGYEDLKLTPDNKWALAEDNAWKAAQTVRIDLRTGIASPVLDAPAGRSLFFIAAPTEVIWSSDSRRVLLSNTFLPIRNQPGQRPQADALHRAAAPAVAIVDLVTHDVQPIAYLDQPARNTAAVRRVSKITWDTDKNEVGVAYASHPDNVPIPYRETYRLTAAGWTEVKASIVAPERDPELFIDQDLNRPPVLVGRLPHTAKTTVIWDPNPQLASIALGTASLYHWQDSAGIPHSGILVMPADYTPGKRYPLVIQTHGYEPKTFFVDGRYTTGSGGRALAATGIIVLQMDQSPKYIDTPNEGPFQAEGFRSAIRQLAADGLVDPRRVGVIGFSFTVFHVLYAITHQPGLFAAASITDGNDLSYWLYLTWTDLPWGQKFAETMNGGVMPFGKEGLLKWAESAPGFNLDRVQTPLLISCLEKGTLVATWDIYGGLRTLKKPVDMVWLRKEDAPHVLVQPRHRYLSQQGAVDWFDFWLNAHEDQDSTKAEQYARWRKLREPR